MLAKNVIDLEVYQNSLTLLKKLYALLKKVPTSEFNMFTKVKSVALQFLQILLKDGLNDFIKRNLSGFL